MRLPGWVLLAAAGLVPASPARAGEVEDRAPDGTLVARYAVDEQGRRHGSFLGFHPSGEVKVKTWYRAGVLEGTFQEFHAGGKERVHAYYKAGALQGNYTEFDGEGRPTLVTSWRAGRIHGKLEAFVQGRRVSQQEWKDGAAVLVDGVAPYPRDLGAMRAAVTAILEGRRPGDPAGAPGPEPPDAEAGLRRLKAYRYLCEVPWEDLALREDLNVLAAAAAAMCRRLGTLTHTPKNPGMPEPEFQLAARGCGGSNLYGAAGGPPATSAGSVDAYMDDSDPKNIDRVGHRRWCLNPRMLFTGFGIAEGFAAMWSTDPSRARVPDYDVVAFPPRGWCFREMFHGGIAWSVSLNPARFSAPGPQVSIAVYPLDRLYRRAPEPLPLENVKVATSGAGVPYCLIFRPQGLDTSPGKRYGVEISGVERAKGPPGFRYIVEFEDLRPSDDVAADLVRTIDELPESRLRVGDPSLPAIVEGGLPVLPALFDRLARSGTPEARFCLQLCVKQILREDYLARHPETRFVAWVEEDHSVPLLAWWDAQDRDALAAGNYALPPVLRAVGGEGR